MAGDWQVRTRVESCGLRAFTARGRDPADNAWNGVAKALERRLPPADILDAHGGLSRFSKALGRRAGLNKNRWHAGVRCPSEMRSCGDTASGHLREQRERLTSAHRVCARFASYYCMQILQFAIEGQKIRILERRNLEG
jgi:hypothetical protein